MHHALMMGTVDRRGYGGQQKDIICDACGLYPSIWCTLKPVFRQFIVLTSRSDTYILIYDDFCANNNDNDNNNDDDKTDYFTPLCMRAG